MRALCPSCGLHHEVVRVLEDVEGPSESRGRDVYQVAALEECAAAYLSDGDVMLAGAKFGLEPIVADEDD